jgi:type IV secretory pathway VirD2 relaxase
MSNQNDFLSKLQAGDEVIYRWGSIHNFYAVRKVAKTTKTQVVLESGQRFRKDNGYELGKSSYNRILEANEANMAIVDGKESKKRRINKARQITATRLDELSEAALDAIQAIIDAELTN